jgi:hypothetical protein
MVRWLWSLLLLVGIGLVAGCQQPADSPLTTGTAKPKPGTGHPPAPHPPPP